MIGACLQGNLNQIRKQVFKPDWLFQKTNLIFEIILTFRFISHLLFLKFAYQFFLKLYFFTDKQQEVDINTLRAAQSEIRKDASGNILASPNKSKISTTVATINESSEPVTEDASGGISFKMVDN